jgi:hypothetical protein
MKTFVLKFSNGREIRRMLPDQQYPDEIFAMMAGERYAPLVFQQHWNEVKDQAQWEIMVYSREGHMLMKEPFSAITR